MEWMGSGVSVTLLFLFSISSVCCLKCPDSLEARIPPGETCARNVATDLDVPVKPGIDCFSEGKYKFTRTSGGDSCNFEVKVEGVCSWNPNHCWPGDCKDDLVHKCKCRVGFSKIKGNRCKWYTIPILDTCRVAVNSSQGENINSTNEGGKTDCSSQRDEYMNIQPSQLSFVIKAHFNKPQGSLVGYVSESKIGIVGANITAVKVSLDGSRSTIVSQDLQEPPSCQRTVSAMNPVINGSLHDCEGTLPLPQSKVDLKDGESVCAVMEATAGGYYKLQDYNGNYNSTQRFPETKRKKQVCFRYDKTKPSHCRGTGSSCQAEPLTLSSRLLRDPEVTVHVDDWTDERPPGGNSMSASGIVKFSLEVHRVNVGQTSLSVDDAAITDLTKAWNASTSTGQHAAQGGINVTLPQENAARLYALILEVHDKAGNVRYARRLVLLDNTSSVDLLPNSTVSVVHANPSSRMQWQTDVFKELCVNWTGRFYNTDMYHNNLLMKVATDSGREIYGHYDQISGLLPVNGTDNVLGITKFEISWSRNQSPRSSFTEVRDLFAQATCLQQSLSDGETYDIWVRATDIMQNSKEDSVRVSIDCSGPEVSVEGLRGRWNREGLYVHNNTDLSTMTLVLIAADPHSGLQTIHWTVSTHPLAKDVGEGAVGVQRLDNMTSCNGTEFCYCPSVGDCEVSRYLVTFTNLVDRNSHQGDHHREYYITVTVTNVASLSTTTTVDILLDESPPVAGVVWEGLGEDEQAEMDFSSSQQLHVRWHGFQDPESGIMLYRVLLAERCMTNLEMDELSNVTEVEKGNMATLTFPAEGHYYVSVVAYNGALEPSKVACSDGITYDSTPPSVQNISIIHAQSGQMLGCTHQEQPWLIQSNLTRIALHNTTVCHNICYPNSSVLDVDHLPLSSQTVVDQELSEHYCKTLPKMTQSSTVVLPSDYLTLTWQGQDEESQIEDYYIGMGSDVTSSSAPDLLPFTTTHGHTSYHARHVGLGHGDTFIIFVQVVNKAGLSTILTLGPVLIDATAPEVTQALRAVVEEDFLLVTWNKGVFFDPEQPSGVELQVTFRIGSTGGFVTPFLTLSKTSLAQCQKGNITGCVRYPVKALYVHDTEQSQFFFQIHVINAAGHITTVNTSSVRLPAHYPPSHSVIKDVLKTMVTVSTTATTSPAVSPFTSKATSADPVTDDFSQIYSSSSTAMPKVTDESTEAYTPPSFKAQFSKDVDVVLHQEQMCVTWTGFYHEEEISIHVGIGTSSSQDDALNFRIVRNENPVCLSVLSLPVYTKLFSVIKATSSGGTSVFSSDGFVMIPATDSENKVQVFNGNDCHKRSIIGSQVIDPSVKQINLNDMLSSLVHAGDFVFVQTSPFISDIAFQNAVLLYTTLTGYQLVIKTPNVTATFPGSVPSNVSLQIQLCQKDSSIILPTENHLGFTWEMVGPWTPYVKYFRAEIIDQTCLDAVVKKEKYRHQQCTLHEEIVPSSVREVKVSQNHRHNGLIYNHSYISTISPCFDDGCFSRVTSLPVIYTNPDTVHVIFHQATILSISEQQLTVQVQASTEPVMKLLNNNLTCVYQWVVSSDRNGAIPLMDWMILESPDLVRIEIQEQVTYTRNGRGSLYVCLRLIHPWLSQYPECSKLSRPLSSNSFESFHIIELPHSVYRQTNLKPYLYSQQLGSKLHDLYNLDLNFAKSDEVLCAMLTNSHDMNVTWFLMMERRVPLSGSCAGDAECVMSTRSGGLVVLPRHLYNLQSGHMYYICAVASGSNGLPGSQTVPELCGDGIVIDDTPPVQGSVTIVDSDSGYLADGGQVLVSWSGFADVETEVPALSDTVTLNFSVALGSYNGGEDLAPYIQVGQRTIFVFNHVRLTSGVTCIATVRAQDRVGHVTESWSSPVVIDSTPPVIGHVAAGRVTQENFVPGHDIPVHWKTVKDPESGIRDIQVGVTEDGGGDTVIEFRSSEGMSTTLTDTSPLIDGHSYVVLLKVTNGAGLTSLKSSAPFVVDSSPPSPGHVWHNNPDISDFVAAHWKSICSTLYQLSTSHEEDSRWMPQSLCITPSHWQGLEMSQSPSGYSTQISVYSVKWTGFTDPHSGLNYFRVGLGSSPRDTDKVPFVYVGRQTSYTWKLEFDQGTKYYATLQACNRAGLCRITSSGSLIYDNSPPTSGLVTVGLYGHRNKYVGHNSSLPVQWTGFSDPQSGIQHFTWCVGGAPKLCNVIPLMHTLLTRASHKAGISLPVATPLYVTVRATNGAGLETVSVSDNFIVDPTPPEVVVRPHFLSVHDDSPAVSQWDRSVLRLAWQFRDEESSVVHHTVYLRSKLTGRLVVDPQVLGAVDQLTLTLGKPSLLVDGDFHWISVSACNAAHLCVTATSDSILIDSTPPVTGTFESPLNWSQQKVNNTDIVTVVDVSWRGFSDAESEVTQYQLIAGRNYNGEELSDGRIMVHHTNATHSQHHKLYMRESLTAGDTVHLAVLAENTLGLHSPLVRMAFHCLYDNSNSTSGTLVLIRHSCQASYCTQECTCAAAGQVCEGNTSSCLELNTSNPALPPFQVLPFMGTSQDLNNSTSLAISRDNLTLVNPQIYTTSAKCLQGHWHMLQPESLVNMSRFEFSFSLANMSAGEGVFDSQTEPVWHDVGHHMTGMHCMPGNRTLVSGQWYMLHVRVWLSRDSHMTFVSSPVMVDHSPPQVKRGSAIIDSDVTCSKDIDYVTSENSNITACWTGVFRDSQSTVVQYQIWMGTSPMASDYQDLTDVGLNTSWTLPTSSLDPGRRYYFTVRAWNAAGLQAVLVSDGFLLDTTPPLPGVVFASDRYRNRHAQSSTTSILASWQGFEDRHSGVRSYKVSLYDAGDETVPVLPYLDAGVRNELLLQHLSLKHAHSYKVVVKAVDTAGLESDSVQSAPVLVDVTPPEGIACDDFQLSEEVALSAQSVSSTFLDTYTADVITHLAQNGELMKVEVRAEGIDHSATAYLQVSELKMPLVFSFSPSGVATAQHSFLSPHSGNLTTTVLVEAQQEASITAKLYRCLHAVPSSSESVTIRQISESMVTVCSLVQDQELGIKSMMVGVGTTEGGLQVQPWTRVGYSGHMNMDTHVQHSVALYATVVAENQAGKWSRFTSRPIIFDRTGPLMSEVHLTLRYEDQDPDNMTDVWAEGRWTVEDVESGLEWCTCHLEGHETDQSRIQHLSNISREGECHWKLSVPQHGSKVKVTVICYNKVQLSTSKTSVPTTILLRPPNITEVTMDSLSNNPLMSPYDRSTPLVRSSSSSLQFCWHGIQDPTISHIYFRYLLESRALTEWSPFSVYSTAAVLEKRDEAPEKAVLTAELQAINERGMKSDVISTTVQLDDRKPTLTDKPATLSYIREELTLDWHQVFDVTRDVTYSVFAGTKEGNGDVINHVTTKTTHLTEHYAKPLSRLYISIQAVYDNGLSSFYREALEVYK